MGENITTLRCPQCGSNDVDRLTQSSGICMHCGASVYIKELVRENNKQPLKPLSTPSMAPNRKESNKKKVFTDNRPLIEKAYTFDVKWDQVEFLRSALIAIASDKTAPDDILDGEIKPVFSEMHHYYCMAFDHEVEYSCSIGYNRTESYKEYENEVAVTNTRTVVDWTSHSGSRKLRDAVIVRADKSDDIDSDRFIDFVYSDDERVSIKGTRYDKTPLIELTEELNEHALYMSQENADYECVTDLPGDEEKNYNSIIESTLEEVEYYVVEDYVLNIVHNGEIVGANSFAGVKAVIKRIPSTIIDIKDQIQKETKKEYTLAMSYMGVYAVLVTLFLFVKGFFDDQTKIIFEAIAILLFIPCVVFHLMYEIKRIRCTKATTVQNNSIKKHKLEQILARMNLALLSPDENKLFNSNKEKK